MVGCKKTWRNNISFKKETEKILRERLDKNFCKVWD